MSKKKRRENSREVLKIAICGLLAALTYVLLTLGSVVEFLDFSVVMIASFPILFCMLEMEKKYAVLTWLTSSLVSFLILPSTRFPALVYFLFGGLYPIIKPAFQKFKKPIPFVMKLIFVFFDFAVIFLLSAWMFPADEESGILLTVVFGVIAIFTFFVYDFLLDRITDMYFWKWRKILRIKDLK